jgi:hypothetical protein
VPASNCFKSDEAGIKPFTIRMKATLSRSPLVGGSFFFIPPSLGMEASALFELEILLAEGTLEDLEGPRNVLEDEWISDLAEATPSSEFMP